MTTDLPLAMSSSSSTVNALARILLMRVCSCLDGVTIPMRFWTWRILFPRIPDTSYTLLLLVSMPSMSHDDGSTHHFRMSFGLACVG